MDRDITARRLAVGVCALLLVDVVGGLLAIANDVNTADEAWSSQATLAGSGDKLPSRATGEKDTGVHG